MSGSCSKLELSLYSSIWKLRGIHTILIKILFELMELYYLFVSVVCVCGRVCECERLL